MKLKKFDRKYWPMFWIGLVIWLGSVLIMSIFEWIGSPLDGQDTVMGLGKNMFQSMPLFTVLLLCVLQPFIEEVGFRLWGVGKKWMTIVGLIVMAVFVLSEMKLWGLLFLGGFIAVWLCVKDPFKRNWANTLITSAAFALSHVSGYAGLSLGMVLGLLDIFGMAIVMCWLVLNIGFWASALLHMLNNSLAILLPMIFLPAPATLHCYSVADGTKSLAYNLTMEPVHPFADNSSLMSGSTNLWELKNFTTKYYLVGEPAELAAKIAGQTKTPKDVYFDWTSQGVGLEERVVLRVDSSTKHYSFETLLEDYGKLVKNYRDDPLVFDTTEFMLKEIWLVYKDGREVLYDGVGEESWEVTRRVTMNNGEMKGNVIYTDYEVSDTGLVNKVYCRLVENPLASYYSKLDDVMDAMYDYRIEYRDAHKAKLITIK